MTICPGCQTTNRDSVRFCKNCGQPLKDDEGKMRDADTAPLANRRCSQCGSLINRDSHFCKVCGAPTSPLSVGPINLTHCLNCGAEVPAQSQFCKECGKTLHVEAHQQSRIASGVGQNQIPGRPPSPNRVSMCRSCGAEIRDGAKFCRRCGTNTVPPDHAGKIFTTPSPTPPSRFGTGELAPSQIIMERYLILDKVAQGGMGAVYKARDDRLGGKMVALKEMSENAINAQDRGDILEAFNREAELLARLNHPNLVRVTDRFQQGPNYYMVMEFIDGKTLAQIIEVTKKPFPVDRVLIWAEQVCDALHYLHNQKPPIIYRDLKPGNIMVNEQTDNIKLIDFGIARFYKQGKSKDTITFGTQGYAPPEQYGSGQTDVRADIYALGVTLFELLTLQDPTEHMMGIGNIRSINPGINPRLATTIEKAVQPDRRKRHQNITDFWEALSDKPARWTNATIHAIAEAQKTGGSTRQSTPTQISPKQNGVRDKYTTVDFGELTAHRMPFQRSRKLIVPPGYRTTVSAADFWVNVQPEMLNHAGGELVVTVDTHTLRPGKYTRSTGILRWWVNLHTRRLVPEAQEYRSYVNLEHNRADTERINIKVLIKPAGWRVFLGWLAVVPMMGLELIVFLAIVAGIIWLVLIYQ